MGIYNSLLTGIIDYQATPLVKDIFETLRPEQIHNIMARKVFEVMAELRRRGLGITEHEILFAGAGLFAPHEVEWVKELCCPLAAPPLGATDLSRIFVEVKRQDAAKQMQDLIAPFEGAVSVKAEELAKLARGLSSISATMETKKLEVRNMLGSAEILALGDPLVPYDRSRNLVCFGLPTLDARLKCGPGSLGVIAAITGAGKTTMAIQMAVKTAMMGNKTLMVSLEMTHEEMHAKAIGHMLGDQAWNLIANRMPRLFAEEQKRALALIQTMCPGSCQDWGQLEARIRELHAEEGYSAVVIDYFTLLEPAATKRGENMAQLYGQISKAAKRMAQDLGIVVVMVAQFNRSAEEYEEPKLKDLRETGQLENDATWALLMWNTKETFKGITNPIMMLRNAKNRFDGNTVMHLEVDRKTGNFYEISV